MKNSSNRFPTLCRLRELLVYSADTGVLSWAVDRQGQMRRGDVAGTVDGRGYLRIRIDGVDYRAHRLAWMLHYGVAPSEEIDHINRIKLDNRIENLRDTDRSVNVLNRDVQKNNTTGVVGVNWRKDSQRWTASISKNKRSRHLGYFDNIEDAIRARRTAEIQAGR